jgi:uncharacterized protein involved in type VI secretion and phage assembly
MSLLGLLPPPAASGPGLIHGVVTGVVTNNQDPDGLGRVKLRFPWLSDTDESAWARVAAAMAGPNRGLFLLPEVEDEVLVAFEHGDPRFPYVLGALWNGRDAPPADNADGKNDIRVLRSRSGHVIRLTDADGAGKIEITDRTGDNTVTIDSASNTVTIAGTNITIKAGSGKLRLEGASIEIEASGPASLKGATVDIN